jgi:hypothetical protein
MFDKILNFFKKKRKIMAGMGEPMAYETPSGLDPCFYISKEKIIGIAQSKDNFKVVSPQVFLTRTEKLPDVQGINYTCNNYAPGLTTFTGSLDYIIFYSSKISMRSLVGKERFLFMRCLSENGGETNVNFGKVTFTHIKEGLTVDDLVFSGTIYFRSHLDGDQPCQ